MTNNKWEFLIPDIQELSAKGITSKAEMARLIIEKHELTDEQETVRLAISKLINNKKVLQAEDSMYLHSVDNVIEALREKGFNPKLKSLWKGPSKDLPGFSIDTQEEGNLWKELLDELTQDIKAYSPKVHKVQRAIKPKKSCAIINLFDAHIDKISVLGDHTLEENCKAFEEAFDKLLNSVIIACDPEAFIIPVGSDFFNSNVFSGTTKKGTPQGANADPSESFRVGIRTYRNCIDKAAQYGVVKVPVIKGNHDEDTDFYLGHCLALVYENNENVEVDDSKDQRKYYKYGENLFGFAHGDKEKRKVDQLPLIMAEEEKQLWADTTYREWYLGDIHHKVEYKFTRGEDFVGCMVRFLRSVGGSGDQWHNDQGYIGIPKTAEAFVWSENNGMEANFLVNL
jgi:hypothetical protein